jgi:hypothetical protein
MEFERPGNLQTSSTIRNIGSAVKTSSDLVVGQFDLGGAGGVKTGMFSGLE